MNITEEQKQEAERIIDLYLPNSWGNGNEGLKSATKCAIQDRQSVLELCNKLLIEFNNGNDEEWFYKSKLEVEIQSLTNQISYLKSKI